jgi:ABC-type sulfate transport system permease subunit
MRWARRRWEVVWDVVLPYTRSAVIGGVFLGLGRALGETMAVTFVIGNAYSFRPRCWNPAQRSPSTIANEFGEALDPTSLLSLLALALRAVPAHLRGAGAGQVHADEAQAVARASEMNPVQIRTALATPVAKRA